MALLDRLKALLTPAEDPRARLDELGELRKALAEVVVARERLQVQANEAAARLPRLQEQARQYMAANHEEAARGALEQRQRAAQLVVELEVQIGELQDDEALLTQHIAALSELRDFGAFSC